MIRRPVSESVRTRSRSLEFRRYLSSKLFDYASPVPLRRNEESPLVFDSGVLRFLEIQMLSSRCFFKIFFPRGVILYPCFELRGLSGRVISMLSSSRAGSR